MQALYIFKRISEALGEAGAEMRHVVRSRAFLTDMAGGGGGLPFVLTAKSSRGSIRYRWSAGLQHRE
ncbi:MAG: hypothetical protein R3D29_08325 [Nitratireductor sp.]